MKLFFATNEKITNQSNISNGERERERAEEDKEEQGFRDIPSF